MSVIHDRMPVILGRADEEAWRHPEMRECEACRRCCGLVRIHG
jgi:putative SOS response-associated peptidase YedK